MGFFDKKAEQLAIKHITNLTGQEVSPRVCVPCESSIVPRWRGYCVLTDDSLYLVNKTGARGIAFTGISRTSVWGQYSTGTNGYPNYRFMFLFNFDNGSFTVYSTTEDGGKQLETFLNKVYPDSN